MENKNDCPKSIIPRWMIDVVVMLLFGAYGYIFINVTDRIETVEIKVEGLNPTLMQIQTDLAEIKTDLKWIKEKK